MRHGFHHWVRKIPRRKAVQPFQYSCSENPMDRGAWWTTVHRISESDRTEAYEGLTDVAICGLSFSLFCLNYSLLLGATRLPQGLWFFQKSRVFYFILFFLGGGSSILNLWLTSQHLCRLPHFSESISVSKGKMICLDILWHLIDKIVELLDSFYDYHNILLYSWAFLSNVPSSTEQNI